MSTVNTVATPLTFVEKVIAFLNGGDNAKVSSFQKDTVKYLKGQIEICNKENDELADKIVDSNEELQEMILSVDLAQIAKTDDRKAYVPVYVRNINAKNKAIKALEASIEANKEAIANFEKLMSQIVSQ